jgi:hypothetical protein
MWVLVALLAFGAWTGGVWYKASDQAVTSYKAKLEEQQKKIDEQAAKIKEESANHIVDMQAAFEAGQAKAKVITRTVLAKGADDVSKYPVFSNPDCVLPNSSLQLVNGARAGMRTPANTASLATTLPYTGPVTGRVNGNDVPADAAGRTSGGSVVGVPATPRPTGGGNEIPGSGVHTHPKPKPVQ